MAVVSRDSRDRVSVEARFGVVGVEETDEGEASVLASGGRVGHLCV